MEHSADRPSWHSLNYFRQMILCEPDLTLEPADILQRDVESERVNSIHVCNDWRQVYDAMATNWQQWIAERETFVNGSVDIVVPGII